MKRNVLTRLDEAANKAREEGHEEYADLFEDAAHVLRAVVSDAIAMNKNWLKTVNEANEQIKAHLEELRRNDEVKQGLLKQLEQHHKVLADFRAPGLGG